MDIREKYKIVAFCSLVKYHRVDSCIRKDKKCYQLAPEFGMCTNSYTKYFKLCKELGLMVELRSNYKLIALPEIVRKLEMDLDRHCRWTNWEEYKEINFRSIYEKVVYSLIVKNYKQQQHNIDRKQRKLDHLFSNGNLEVKRKVSQTTAKQAAKRGMTFNQYVQCLREELNKDIVSGKHHVANLIGYSATSGRRWLSKMDKCGMITREIVRKYADLPVVHGSFDVLVKERDQQGSSHVIIPTSKGWVLSLGSKIHLHL
jgi:hypothetical protein